MIVNFWSDLCVAKGEAIPHKMQSLVQEIDVH